MQINKLGHHYPTITKKKREVLEQLMNTCDIIINWVDRRSSYM